MIFKKLKTAYYGLRFLIGALIVGVILAICPGNRSFLSCLLAGAFATLLLLQLGSRSIVEKVGALLTAAAIAWLAGPRPASSRESFIAFVAGWTVAASALAAYLHPRAE